MPIARRCEFPNAARAACSTPLPRSRAPRLAYRDVASSTNRLSLIAAVLPAGVVTTHSLFCLKTTLSSDTQAFLCAMLNSYVANYLVRQVMTTHLGSATVEALRVPKPRYDSPVFEEIVGAGAPAEKGRMSTSCTRGLQALAARCYGLTEDEFAHVLSTFPLIDASERRQALETVSQPRRFELGYAPSPPREEPMAQVSMTVNGKVRKGNVEPRVLLVHFLREQLRLTGTHIGCDTSQCGACTVLIDGRSAKSCTIFAVQADGSTITTIEGLAPRRSTAPAAGRLLGGARPPVRLLHAGDDHGGRDAAAGQPDAVGAGDPRGHLRQFLPLHRLPAHRQRHSARRKQEVSHGPHLPCCRSSWASASSGARIRVSFRAAPPTSTTSRSSACSTSSFKRSDVAHGRIRSIDTSAAEAMDGVEAVFTGAQIAELLRADADRHAVPFAGPSRRRRRHGPLRGRTGRGRRGERSVRRARRRRRDRRDVRHAAGGRRSRNWR